MKSQDLLFYDDDGNELMDGFILPFRTLELIISNKNIFVNLRNADPQKIYYHLNNTQDWYPFIQISHNSSKTGETKKKIWNVPLASIYEIQNIQKCLNAEEVDMLQLQIFKSTINELSLYRNSINAMTKYRTHYEKVTEMIGHYCIILENTETGRVSLQ